MIAEWGSQCWNRVSNDVVWNSWRHEPFSYFPGEETGETTYDDDDDMSYSSSSSSEDSNNDEGDDVIEEL